ncbi:hypothetical protein BDV96DRAFT_626317 [Lophiotrema nucula]|uniref:Uncharacterized protein n=1 Tax=Lophiotrema nucula TaxID=690887 RepID=A0A6A5YDB6_9PLEO|nr:hypothetical protein BDV96DRAFT_626317 [Lophiotrema nucula]
MSASTLVLQLKGLLVKIEQLQPKLCKVSPTEDQWEDLSSFSGKLTTLAKGVEDEIRVLKKSRTQRAWRESEEHRRNAQSARFELLARGLLKNPHIFRRNIIMIFEGPKNSKFDSEDVELRKESTRKRCELIRSLSPDGVISWSIAFAPTLWAGGSIAADVFTCLLDAVEPDLAQAWPSTIRETLHLLREDEESLENCHEYNELVIGLDFGQAKVPSAIDDKLPQQTDRRKRRRIEDGNVQEDSMSVQLISPLDENREMKHMYTNAPASDISKIPEPFHTFIQNSRLWKWERSQGIPRTACWGTLFPKGDAQDASLTIWGGHEDGYQLNEAFGLQLALSS